MQNPEWIWTFLDATKRKIIHCLNFRLSCLFYIYITRVWTGHMRQYTTGNHIRKLNVYIYYIIKKEYINLPVLQMHLLLLVLYLFGAIVLIPVTIFLLFINARLPHVGLSFHSILVPPLWSTPQYVSLSCFLLTHVYRSYFDACISYMLHPCLFFTYLLHAMQAWLDCI